MQQKKLALGMCFPAGNAAFPVKDDIKLHIAVHQGNAQTVDSLLAESVDVNARDETGWTPLHVAATKNDPRIVDALLSRGADPEVQTKEGLAALHLAAQHGRSDIVRVLLGHRADLAARTHQGATALEIAAASRRIEALRAMVEYIGHLGEHEDIAGPTLHAAATKGDAACIRLLLAAGASPDTRVIPEEGTPLMKAASFDNFEAAEALLDAGAGIEATFRGATAVLIAALRSNTRVLQLLISRGANIDVVDEQGFTPLRAAIHNNDITTTRLLFQHRVRLNTTLGDHKDTALHWAVHYGNPALLQMLLDKGAYVDPAEADGDTPLQWAVHKGDIDIVKTLLCHGADIDRKNPNTGEVVLGWAVKCGHLGVTKYLISHGADRSLVDLNTIQKDPTATEQDFITCKALVETGSCSSGQDSTDKAAPHIRPSPPASASSPDKMSANSPVDKATSALSAGDPGFLQSHDRVEQRGPSDFPSTISQLVKEVVSLPETQDTVNSEANINCYGTIDASQMRFKLIDIGPHKEFERLISSLSYAVEHSGVTCDGEQCKSTSGPIRGTRYKCAVCEDIDFCSRCVVSFFNKHSAHHAMIRVLLPAELYRILEIDQGTQKQLLERYNDSDVTLDDFSHAIYAATDQAYFLCLINDATLRLQLDEAEVRTLLDGSQPTVFAIWKDRTTPPAREKTPFFREGTPGPNTVTTYEIDDAANVRVRYHEKGTMPDGVTRPRHVVHHQDPVLLTKVITGQMAYHNYHRYAQFYNWINAGRMATRVVDINPGAFDDKLDICLRVIDLLEGPAYEALSWTWKETAYERAAVAGWNKETDEAYRDMSQLLHGVYLTDEKGVEAYLQVSCGLRDALKRLRDPHRTVSFWIDQLSINQGDLDERALQVSRMPLCYERAKRVVVWTGDEVEHTALVFDLCKVLAQTARHRKKWPGPGSLAFEAEGYGPRKAAIWTAVFDFYDRPVFTRCWCVQEIAMGLEVVVRCGEHYIRWEDLATAAQVLSQRPWVYALSWVRQAQGPAPFVAETSSFGHLLPGFLNVVMMNGIREEFRHTGGLPLENLLFHAGKFEASDPRDKVYSMFGLQSSKVTLRDVNDIHADYRQSTAEVFTAGTRTCIMRSNSLNICGMTSSMPSKCTDNLPSWVPDYASNAESVATSLSRPEPTNPYKACGDVAILAEWPYENRKDLLVASACKADVATAVSERALRPMEPAVGSLTEDWAALADQCYDESGRYQNGEFGPGAFCRTLTGDCDGPCRQYPAPASFYSSLSTYLVRHFTYHVMDVEKATGTLLNPESPVRMSRTISTLVHAPKGANPDWFPGAPEAVPGESLVAKEAFFIASLNRKFFVTRRGYMGIGPKDMQPDDEIHVLSGTSVPFVMRKVTDEADASTIDLAAEDGLVLYRMIGECYVHGIMQGEATRRDDAEWDGICIC